MATPTLEKILADIEQLSSEDRTKLVIHLQTLETEQEWENRSLCEVLGNTLQPDGSIDFDRLYQRHGTITGFQLHQEYPEYVDKDGNIPEEDWGENE